MHGGMIWTFFRHFHTPLTTRKSGFFQREGERVARGHFHERMGETPVHWLSLGVGPAPKPFSVSENGPFEICRGSNSAILGNALSFLRTIPHRTWSPPFYLCWWSLHYNFTTACWRWLLAVGLHLLQTQLTRFVTSLITKALEPKEVDDAVVGVY